MKLPLLATMLVLLALSGISVACGDSKDSPEGAPLETYYAGLSGIGGDFVDALAAQPQGLDRSEPIADQIDVFETYTHGLAGNIRTARDALQDLDAPPEVADGHATLLASVENALSVAESLEDEIGEINSSEDLQRLSNNPEVASAFQQFQTACTALRDIATENSITTEIRCE